MSIHNSVCSEISPAARRFFFFCRNSMDAAVGFRYNVGKKSGYLPIPNETIPQIFRLHKQNASAATEARQEARDLWATTRFCSCSTTG